MALPRPFLPMARGRGGIERKFVTSILGVAFIPMMLAMVIGYVFAREGQQTAVMQNLSTAVQTTAGGIRLALEQQLEMLDVVARGPEVVAALRQPHAGAPTVPEPLIRLAQPPAGKEFVSAFALYDSEGRPVLYTSEYFVPGPEVPDWFGDVTEPRYVNFAYNGRRQSYYNELVAPVRDPDNGEVIGYLAERRAVDELLRSLLDKVDEETGEIIDSNSYELINLDAQFIVYLQQTAGAPPEPPGYYRLDKELAEQLEENRARVFDSFYQGEYSTRGRTIPALMAYHRLDPQTSLYLLAYRNTRDVFAIINIGAIGTFIIAGTVIGFLVLISYLKVHNNIIRPVALLNEGAQIVRQGDLELKLVIDTGDEIEELAMSFNKMATALRQNISQLEASEERYRSLFDSMRDGVFQTDAEGSITLINPAGARILGFDSPAQVMTVKIESLFLEQMDYARVRQQLEHSRFIERTRVWLKTQDNRSICAELGATPVFDAGEFVGLEGTFQDVTDNVRLEQEARERSERISAINMIANAINSSLEAGRVYESLAQEIQRVVDFDYAAVALVQQVEEGEEADEEATQRERFLVRQLWPEQPGGAAEEQDGNSAAAWVAREQTSLLVDDLDSEGGVFRGQFPRSVRSCLCVPLHATGRIIGTLNLGARHIAAFSKHEQLTLEEMSPHIAVAIRNAQLLENLQVALEETTRSRERLHEANEELKTLDELKTNLLSNVSHELRTPLVAVMGYTDMILNRKVGPINEVQEEYLGISLRNIEKLVALIENLLDFSRLHRGDEDMFFDTFDLVDCARTSIQVVQPVADSRNIAVTLNITDPGAENTAEPGVDEKVLVEGDKGKMGQVFTNLLSNAVKFNHSGGHVTIKLDVNQDLVDVTVWDDGIGIPEAEQAKIFNRFYQVDSSSTRKYGGTGIGLAIVQDIVRLHGSNITVSSKEGEGTAFRFSLALSPAHRRGREGDGGHTLPIPTETHLLIELVSQDRALSNQIRSMLLSEGMDVIHAAYPAMAVSLATKYSPDCILVDTEAGPMGSMVVEEILSDPSAAQLPIVLLTNDDDLYERVREQVAGRVRRGFRKSTLLGGIHYALSRGVQSGEQLGNKVLCVDDDEEILRFMTRCIEQEGYEVESCGSGEEAIALAESGAYWMVLMDIAMPGMDGWETCSRIRHTPGLAGIRLYMVTAKPMDQARSRLQESGADGYILKPFHGDELMEIFTGYEWRKKESADPATEVS
jgi:PAS domain S-box-containing protein